MKKFKRLFTVFILAGIVLQTGAAQTIRQYRDTVGYCWKLDQMTRLIEYLASVEKDTPIAPTFIAGVAPHDDYLYAAKVYYPLFRSLKTKEVVIFGVTHKTVRMEIGDPKNILLFDSFDSWRGLRSNVPISPLREFVKARLDTSMFAVNNKAHQLEHSIEAFIPFLQYFNPDIRITPIMVTAMPYERMEQVSTRLAEIFSEYIQKEKLILGRDIVFLSSCDANHYGKDFDNAPFGEDEEAHTKGIAQDKNFCNTYLIDVITPQKIKGLTEEMGKVVWCGKFSVPFGLLTAEKTAESIPYRKLAGTILRASDSYTEGVLPLKETSMGTTAPVSLKHWVSYFSAAYYSRLELPAE
jgi:AmmeMemoRadiSam system protein B